MWCLRDSHVFDRCLLASSTTKLLVYCKVIILRWRTLIICLKLPKECEGTLMGCYMGGFGNGTMRSREIDYAEGGMSPQLLRQCKERKSGEIMVRDGGLQQSKPGIEDRITAEGLDIPQHKQGDHKDSKSWKSKPPLQSISLIMINVSAVLDWVF